MTTEEIERYNRGFLMEIDMPNPGAERPLRKITLNLFADDVELLRSIHTDNWSVEVRQIVFNHCEESRAFARKHNLKYPRRTLGDLE